MPSYLLDTNVFLRVGPKGKSGNELLDRAIDALREQGYTLCYTPQNIIECWAVVTRPQDANGFGYSEAQALELAQAIADNFELLPDTPEIIDRWQELVVKHAVAGKKVHDARLVAVMIAHRMTRLLTFNLDDFARYDEIEAVAPGAVSA